MRLREYRQTLGLSQAQVAAAIGVTQSDIANWELGRRIPRPDSVNALFTWSAGAVGPADFYDLPALPETGDAA